MPGWCQSKILKESPVGCLVNEKKICLLREFLFLVPMSVVSFEMVMCRFDSAHTYILFSLSLSVVSFSIRPARFLFSLLLSAQQPDSLVFCALITTHTSLVFYLRFTPITHLFCFVCFCIRMSVCSVISFFPFLPLVFLTVTQVEHL